MPLTPQWMLDQEARALLARLARVKPFVLSEPMLLAASLLPQAQIAIERFLAKGRHELKEPVEAFRLWLQMPARMPPPEEVQRRFTYLRLRFNAVLTQFDLFSDVITPAQREREWGVAVRPRCRFGGRPAAAGRTYDAPPVICYLDRGSGRRSAVRAPGCRAVAKTPWPSSASPRADGRQRHRLLRWFTKSVTRGRRCWIWSPRCARPAGRQRGAAETARLGAVRTLDFGDPRRLLVGGPGRRGGHPGFDRRGEPARGRSSSASTWTIPIRCPGSASSSVAPWASALSAPAVGEAETLWESFYPLDRLD